MENITQRWTLHGKCALVTGASKGIGKAIAEEVLALGAEVFILDRNEAEIDNLIQHWQAQHLPVSGIIADVGTPQQSQLVSDTIAQQ